MKARQDDPRYQKEVHRQRETHFTAEYGKIQEAAGDRELHFDPKTGGYYWFEEAEPQGRDLPPGPGRGPREGAPGYGPTKWFSNVLATTEEEFQKISEPLRLKSAELDVQATRKIQEGDPVAGLFPYMGARVMQAGAGVYGGVTFALRPVKWGESISGVVSIATSLKKPGGAAHQTAQWIAQDPFRAAVEVGSTYVGAKLFGKIDTKIGEYRLKQFYKKYPPEAFYIDDMHLDFPEEITGSSIHVQSAKVKGAESFEFSTFNKKTGKFEVFGGGVTDQTFIDPKLKPTFPRLYTKFFTLSETLHLPALRIPDVTAQALGRSQASIPALSISLSSLTRSRSLTRTRSPTSFMDPFTYQEPIYEPQLQTTITEPKLRVPSSEVPPITIPKPKAILDTPQLLKIIQPQRVRQRQRTLVAPMLKVRGILKEAPIQVPLAPLPPMQHILRKGPKVSYRPRKKKRRKTKKEKGFGLLEVRVDPLKMKGVKKGRSSLKDVLKF